MNIHVGGEKTDQQKVYNVFILLQFWQKVFISMMYSTRSTP